MFAVPVRLTLHFFFIKYILLFDIHTSVPLGSLCSTFALVSKVLPSAERTWFEMQYTRANENSLRRTSLAVDIQMTSQTTALSLIRHEATLAGVTREGIAHFPLPYGYGPVSLVN